MRRARVAKAMPVLSVVVQPARNRLWICASWARRASPTRSAASAYRSSAAASGSSRAAPACCCCCCSTWLLASAARAAAWLKVLGCGLAEGGADSAACASAGVVADPSRETFSLTVRPRSWNVSLMLGG